MVIKSVTKPPNPALKVYVEVAKRKIEEKVSTGFENSLSKVKVDVNLPPGRYGFCWKLRPRCLKYYVFRGIKRSCVKFSKTDCVARKFFTILRKTRSYLVFHLCGHPTKTQIVVDKIIKKKLPAKAP